MKEELFPIGESFETVLTGLATPEALSGLSSGEKRATRLILNTLEAMIRLHAIIPVPMGEKDNDIVYAGAKETGAEWKETLKQVKNELNRRG